MGAAPDTTGGTAPGAADGTPPAAAPTPAQQLFPPITINNMPAAPAPTPTTQQLFPSLTFPAGTKVECVANTQDAACGFKGHPKCCPGQTLLGTPLQTVAGKGPAVSTRPAKTTTTRSATATNNAACGVNPCGGSALVPTPGKCFKAGTTTLIPCNQSKAAVAYANVGQASRAYLTQVVQGQKRTTIDPFFPAGFYLSQANYRASLREPALH